MVAEAEDMTTDQKVNFKAILKSFIYGGVDNIPDADNPVISEPEPDTGESRLISTLVSLSYWFGILLLVFMGIIALYYVYYKIANKDDNVGFQDFIIDKTSLKKSEKLTMKVGEDVKDVLSEDILSDAPAKAEIDPLAASPSPEQADNSKQTEKDIQAEKIPDWLAGNFSSNSPSTETSSPQVQEEAVILKTQETPQVLPDNTPSTEIPLDIEAETKIEDSSVPDWLKQDFGTLDSLTTQEKSSPV